MRRPARSRRGAAFAVRWRGPLFLLLAALAAWLAPLAAWAHPFVIESGREHEVLALFRPYLLAGEVTEGQRLWNVGIEPKRIVVGVRAPGAEVDETFVLVHPDDGPPGADRTPSFAVARSTESPAARAAERALVEAVRRNDDGRFWRVQRAFLDAPRSSSRRPGIGFDPTTLDPRRFGPLAADGLLAALLGALLMTALARRLLRRRPWWWAAALAGTVAAGAGWRLALSPETYLGAWPWSRLYPTVRTVVEGPTLAFLAHLDGRTFPLLDVIFWTAFAYAVAMPLVLFSHAAYLLRSVPAGLVAAALVAFSPQHIRFSRCEDGFVPSLVLTSAAFALIHAAMREESRSWRWGALAALPFVLLPGYLLRPLNILFVGVYLAGILLVHPEAASRRRRWTTSGVVLLAGALAAVEFFQRHGQTTAFAIRDPEWLLHAVTIALSPRLNALLDPSVTPPVLPVLAGVGVWALWRRGEKRLAVFLLLWLTAFLVAHSFVVVEAMQPRYHLHLLVPFLLLASVGLLETWRLTRQGAVLAAAVLLAAPVLHRPFLRDVGYTEMQELAFVREAAARIPDECVTAEWVGYQAGPESSRMVRLAARVGGPTARRFRVEDIHGSGVARLPEGLERLMEQPPACLYVYRGLQCYQYKDPAEPLARGCVELEKRLGARPILERTLPFRPYDVSSVQGVREGQPITVALSCARGCPAPEPVTR